ncbi:MAG: hypothetical protein AAFP04_00850 [Myxococcota bacterium]
MIARNAFLSPSLSRSAVAACVALVTASGCGDDSDSGDTFDGTRLTCDELNTAFCFNESIVRLAQCRAQSVPGATDARTCSYPNGESVQFDRELEASTFRPPGGQFPEVSATLFEPGGEECGALELQPDSIRIRFGAEQVEYREVSSGARQLEFEVTCADGARYRGDRRSLSSLCGSDVPSFVYGTIGTAAFFQFGLFDETFRVFQCEAN